MTSPARDTALERLLDHHEIRDALLRYCRGVDRRDLALLRSVYHPDAVHEYGDYRMNAHEFAAIIVEAIADYRVTSHFLSNERAEIDGERARVESYVQAVHRKQRDGREIEAVLALRYVDRFERRDGVWRIAHRLSVCDWSRETTLEAGFPGAERIVPGRRDRDDPSYPD